MVELDESYQFRFGGIDRLYGESSLYKLSKSHVGIVGLGGVGSWAAEALVRSGIGEITLIDFDEVCLSNSNRQIQAMTSTVGKSKIQTLKSRFLDINPFIKINCYEEMLDFNNFANLINLNLNFFIDAIDKAKIKCVIIDHCKKNKIPLITTGGAGGRKNPGLIKVSDLTFTEYDSLLARVRRILRQEYNYSKNVKKKFGITCVSSTEQIHTANKDSSNSNKAKGPIDCRTGYGTISTVTATMGLITATEVINQLLER